MCWLIVWLVGVVVRRLDVFASRMLSGMCVDVCLIVGFSVGSVLVVCRF